MSDRNNRLISQAMRKRNGKKYIITKMITEIEQLVQERGSRTKLKYLRDSLQETLQQATLQHEELMLLLSENHPEFNDVWIEELSFRVNTCFANISKYFIDRENDSLSSISSITARQQIETWRQNVFSHSSNTDSKESLHQIPETENQSTNSSVDLTEAFSKLNIDTQQRSDTINENTTVKIHMKSNSMPNLANIPNERDGGSVSSFPAYLSNTKRLVKDNLPNVRNTSNFPIYVSNQTNVKESDGISASFPTETKFSDRINQENTFDRYRNLPSQTREISSLWTSDKFVQDGEHRPEQYGLSTRQVNFSEEAVRIKSRAFGNEVKGPNDHLHSTYLIEKRKPHSADKPKLKPSVKADVFKEQDKYGITERKPMDAWIDELNCQTVNIIPEHKIHDVQMQMLIQQRLPTQKLPTFDGSADKWVQFICNFYDMVHKQPYLDVFQKQTYLTQHLVGEPRKAVDGFPNDIYGYIASLKRLKYMFGNPSLVAQATIQRVTNGGQIPDFDLKALTEFYYSVSSCLNTLIKMDYTADIHSTDVLRRTLKRLPNYLMRKWAEYSFTLRRHEEPTLIHLENWLQERVMAAKDPHLPQERMKRTHPRIQRSEINERKTFCPCCNGDHPMFKCEKYKLKSDCEKLQLVKSKQLCFNCLRSDHVVKNCPSRNGCFTKGCNKRHHTSIHEALLVKKTSQSKGVTSSQAEQETVKSTGQINVMKNDRKVFLQVAPVIVSNKFGHSIQTYALLDSGSQCTIITKSLCQSLNLPGKVKKVKLGTIKDEEALPAKVVDLQISSTDGSFSSKVKGVYSLHEDHFNVPGQEIPITEEPKWNYIRDIHFPEIKSEQVQVLIGSDVPAALISIEVRKGSNSLPYASKTPLGWTLLGVYEGGASGSSFVSHTRPKICDDNKQLDELVRQFWETESFGTTYNYETPMSVQDKRLLNTLEDETTFDGSHFVVPMLWNSSKALPDSLPIANKRLLPLLKRFRRDEAYFEMYKRNIEDYLDNGYAKKLTKEEVAEKSSRTWYLPHHGVINENKPGKVRMVFDAAAKSCGQSLNSNLSTGPDLLNSLLGVLLRFRKHRIAVVADIQAMFHQVRLKGKDTDAVRFLWPDDLNDNSEPGHYKMLVHIFGATDSPCCASYALKRAALDQKEEFPDEVIQAVLRDFYMDDLLSSVLNEDQGKALIRFADELMANRGFNLTKFNSNSKDVLQTAPAHKRANEASVEFENNVTRALGIKWDLTEDCFFYNVNTESKPLLCTKRSILKKMATVFDPLGFLTPFTLIAKLILQNLWKMKIDWDEEIDDDSRKAWMNWLDELSLVSKTVRIPRSLDLQPMQSVQLHIFCDASEKAFAAIAYVRVEENSIVRCHLIMAKSRVAPLKTLTLPRLELQGAVMAVRLKETIIKEFHHNFQATFFWTDSMLNIQCINNEHRRFKVFVCNRVSEIRQYSDTKQWRFVPGKLNPADLASRGAGMLEANKDSLWFNGPSFLKLKEDDWPSVDVIPLSTECMELRRTNLSSVTEVHNNDAKAKETEKYVKSSMIDFARFSSWRRLVRTVTWIIIFIKNCKLKKRNIQSPRYLTITEENNGEMELIKLIQAEYFPHEIKQLKVGGRLTGCLDKLDTFLDEQGVLRVGGRLKYGDFPYASKHQIVLPAKHTAVVLLGTHHHLKHHHVGKEHLLSLLRQQYWIIGGRVMCKQIIRSCIICQKMKAKPLSPKMANLPEDRIKVSTPTFYHTGVDYFGPIMVKVLRSRVKRWGCIFTCLTTRAIHLEVAPSLESDDFINVLERFICRRGNPRLIRSDCGTNFKGASKELNRELERMDHLKINECLRRKQIQWEFNIPESPHMGGVWERLVRSVKTSLNAILLADGISLNDYTLLTVLTEVEALVNSRPLTPVSDDINDLEALTPNHFIMGRSSTVLPTCVTYNDKVAPRQRWKQVQATTQQFWERWRREYLPILTTRNKWTETKKNVQVGDLVMVLEESFVRGKWSLGRIKKVLPGRDGVVRKVEVNTKNGQYTRPLAKLAPLELN